MCLAIPGKVKSINGRVAMVEYPGQERKAMIGEEVEIGENSVIAGVPAKLIKKREI